MSWCGCVCNTVEDAAEWVEETVEDTIDAVTDAVEDAIEDICDFVEDAAEWVEEGIKDAAEFVAEVATKVWDWITETASSIWDWIKKTAGDVWEWTTGALEDAWDWVRDTASDAWDWICDTAETVWDGIVAVADAVAEFVEKKVVPFLLDCLWVLTHIDEFLIGIALGLYCLITQQDEKEYDVIEGMFMLDDDALSKRKVAFLPITNKYVIFSDLHLFVAGDSLDRFRQIGNHELYQVVLAAYSLSGHTLVENGDIEDLWMKETTLSGAILEETCDILGYPFGSIMEDEIEDTRIRSQAVKIFDNNADVYQTIRNLFFNKGRYVRILGNHDDYWRNSDYLEGLRLVYPGIEVFDYAFIGNYTAGRYNHQGHSPQAIIAHGHQIDAWNNSMCRDAGRLITGAVSGIPSLAASVVERSEWEEKLSGAGFDNELSDSMASVDEVEFYETIEDDFSNHGYVPQFVLGHTHRALEDPQIPNWMFRDEWNFDEYTNDGTAGRWEQFIWCVTVENGNVQVHGWTWGPDNKPYMYDFSAVADSLQAT